MRVHNIQDSSVILRKFEQRDVESLWKFRNDKNIADLLGGFSTGYSRQDLCDWIEGHRSLSNEVLYSIVDDVNDLCIGHVGLYQIDHRIRKAEFAILIGYGEYQGQGLGKKITNYMLDFGFDQLNLNKITLTVIEQNARAIALYRGLGFVKEGVARQDLWRDGAYWDVVTMSILRKEWASLQEKTA